MMAYCLRLGGALMNDGGLSAVSDPQQRVQMLTLRWQFGGTDFFDNTPVFHNKVSVCQRSGKAKVLLDEHNSHAAFLEFDQHVAQRLSDLNS